jgi:hypothetical protein
MANTHFCAASKPRTMSRTRWSWRRYWGAAAEHEHGLVVVDAHVVERQVGLGGVAGLLDVGVPARLEVVDHEVQAALAGRRDARREAGLGQALPGVQGLEALAGVAGDDEDCSGHARLWVGPGSSGKPAAWQAMTWPAEPPAG